MRQFLTVVAFVLATIGFFAAYSNYGIPQIEPAPPPKDEVVDLSAMDMGQFVAFGDRLFNGKGTCTLCHNSLGRAPMLDDVSANAVKRLEAAKYAGQATNVEEYLVESLIDPSAYVVEGFGKAGTNDSESPMPAVTGGAIKMSDTELLAVVAFLQSSSGAEVTVEIPIDIGDEVVEEESEESGEPRAAFQRPEELMEEFSCTACHVFAADDDGGDLGPNLSAIGSRRSKDQLRLALLDPNAEIADGFEEDLMPDDMGEQLYASELEILVNFLAGLK